MNFVPKMNRRSFVVGSAAALGGGLALGLKIPFGPDVVRAADGSRGARRSSQPPRRRTATSS